MSPGEACLGCAFCPWPTVSHFLFGFIVCNIGLSVYGPRPFSRWRDKDWFKEVIQSGSEFSGSV